jgi:hypothetical protein
MKEMRKISWIGLMALVVLALGAVVPALAQEMPPLPGELVIGDLNTPRGIAFDANGNLIVTIVGNGGEVAVTMPGPDGETTFQMGMTGKIISVAPDGTSTDVSVGFPSYASPSDVMGLYRAIPQGDSLWVLFSGTGAATTGGFWTDSIAELDAKTLSVKRIINLNAIEASQDPDGAGFDTNVSDIAWGPDGTLYITDAGGNDLLSWTQADGLKVVHAWTDNPVPTAVEVAGNGDLYIGFLGAGLAPGAGKIEHWSGGELKETFGGLNAVSDILLDGDKLYAVELVVFTDQGPGPGRVVMVDASGATPVAEGLISPFGLAKGPDGSLYVSFGTIAFAPGMTGGVVKLSAGM